MLALQQQQRCSICQSLLAYPQRPRQSSKALTVPQNDNELVYSYQVYTQWNFHTQGFQDLSTQHGWGTAAHLATYALSLWRLCVLLSPVLVVTVLVWLLPCRKLRTPQPHQN